MSKNVRITINDENEEYFTKSLTEEGYEWTNSQLINHFLTALRKIEESSKMQIGAFAIALANPDYKDALKYFLNSSYEKAG